MIRPLVCPKTHMFVKADRLRILLVYRQFTDRTKLDPEPQQRFSAALSPVFSRNEQHFEFLAADAHKSDGYARFVLRNDQPRHTLDRRGDEVFDF